MGRKLMRVPLDFTWPLNQVWAGYLNPHEAKLTPCPTCGHTGSSEFYRLLDAVWYRHCHDEARQLLTRYWYPDALKDFARHILASGQGWNVQIDAGDVQALVDRDRLWEWTHVPRTPEQAAEVRRKQAAGGNRWLSYQNGYIPTPAEINAKAPWIHDSINAWTVVAARCSRYDLPTACKVCQSKGHLPDEELEALIDAWEPLEPPRGAGYQLWETTSEGSPISPVFSTLPELCTWLEAHASTFADYSASAAQWAAMLRADNVHHQEGNTVFL